MSSCYYTSQMPIAFEESFQWDLLAERMKKLIETSPLVESSTALLNDLKPSLNAKSFLVGIAVGASCMLVGVCAGVFVYEKIESRISRTIHVQRQDHGDSDAEGSSSSCASSGCRGVSEIPQSSGEETS